VWWHILIGVVVAILTAWLLLVLLVLTLALGRPKGPLLGEALTASARRP
jgi:hypothetical protein